MNNLQKTLVLIIALISINIEAQEKSERISFTTGEFKFGYGMSSFGKNLKERYDAGNFGTSGGFMATLAAYHKFKVINNFTFGMKYKSLGASPAKGDNGQELFFNYWGAALAAKYFPFDKNAMKGFYINADIYFITQFTQKYRVKANNQFEHQFAVGNGYTIGTGYDIDLGKKLVMLTIGIEYEYDSRRGEVNGIGDQTFVSSSFGILAGVKF